MVTKEERMAEKLKRLQERIGTSRAKATRQKEASREMLEEHQVLADKLQEKWSRIPKKGVVHGLEKEGDPTTKHVDFLEGLEDPNKRRLIAILYENTLKEFRRLTELQRAFMTGPYEKAIFGIIRAVYANTILDKIVSVQPLDAPTGRVFYLDVRYGDTKGQIVAGTRAFDATAGPAKGVGYSSEVVENEAAGTGDGTTVAMSGTLDWIPVRPGTVTFSDGTQTVRDDGNGNLIGNCAAGGTVNYVTGVYSFSWSAAPDYGDELTVSYEYASAPRILKVAA